MTGIVEQPLRAYESVAQLLADLGATDVFSLLGSGNFLLVEQLVAKHGVRHHWARHESGVVAAADGWARASGRVGVCTLHQGPGLSNAVTSLIEASKARTSLVVVCGESSTSMINLDNQRVDQVAMVRATGAGVEHVLQGGSAAFQVRRAWIRAVAERRPVVVLVPVDVQEEAGEASDARITLPGPTVPDAADIVRAVDLLSTARRPVILAGRGAFGDGAEDVLRTIGDRIGAIFATSALGQGLFADSPWSVGISGGFSSPLAQELLPQADVVLAAGASLNRWTTGHDEIIPASAALVTINDEVAALVAHRPPEVALLGDAALTARHILALLEDRGHSSEGFRSALTGRDLSEPGWRLADESAPGKVDPRLLMTELDSLLPPGRTVVTDSGRYVGWVAMHMPARRPRGFVFSQAFMSLGLGLPEALGASVARPDQPTVVVTGDGGLSMCLGEMDSLASQRDAVLIVVIDDGAYGAEVHMFGRQGKPTDLAKFGTRDFAGVARALGAQAATVRDLADVRPALADWLRQPDGVFVLDCKVDGAIPEHWSEHALGH